MATETIKVPDIGGSEGVEVIEISVAAGDTVEAEDTLLVLETDKASMDIPCPKAGKVAKVLVKEGDTVSEGSDIVELELEGEAESESGGESQGDDQPAETDRAEPAKDGGDAEPSGGSEEMDIPVPDIGGAEGVEVIEIGVKSGDEVNEGDALIVLETDKASMDIPAPVSGTIASIALKEGDTVSQGDLIGKMTTAAGAAPSDSQPEADSGAAEGAAAETGGEQTVPVPDIGGAEGVEVIEISVQAGDEVNEGDTLIVLETDKASMDIPAPASGKIQSIALKEGDKVSQGDTIGVMETVGGEAPSGSSKQDKQASKPAESQPAAAEPSPAQQPSSPATASGAEVINGPDVYAGPAVRKLGRQMGVDLAQVKGSGPRGRITKDDVRDYVKNIVTTAQSGGGAAAGAGGGIPAVPAVDFAKFGEIETVKMSKIKRLTAENMTRSWLNVPHVTQWDDVDITELEDFRKGLKAEAEKRGTKLTPVPFLLKAVASALAAEPSFNVSLHPDGEHIVQKKYIHVGMAVDTPNGLVVPVIRDVDQKGLWELAEEAMTMAKKARDGKLSAAEMQGGCFTISSLGAMGGSGFTPIVNSPEVGILGVSRAQVKPVWNGSEFVPRNMLPISLSYDHRAINGADAGRFFTYLTGVLADVRRLLL